MFFLNQLTNKNLKFFLCIVFIAFYLALSFLSFYINKDIQYSEISFTRYQANCVTTISDLEKAKDSLNISQDINYSRYELQLFKNPEQLLCVGKVMSIEVDNNNINASIGTSYWLFKVLTFLFTLSIFVDKNKKFKLLYFLNILTINFWLGKDSTLTEYLDEVLPILAFSTILYILKKLEIKNLNNNKSYMQKIDSYRALAVIVVILNHFNKDLLPNGYLGVDIFFVISGFVITKSLLNSENKSFLNFYKDFLIKRFKRIYPVLLFVVLTFLIFINFYDLNVNNTFLTGLSSLFAISNIFLYSQSNEYFSDISFYNSFLHTWSLGIEEQFYILFPIVYFLFIKNKRYFKYFLTFFVLISVYFFINKYNTNFSAAYYLPQYRFWEIATGSLIALLPGYKNSTFQYLNFLLMGSLLFYSGDYNFLLHIGVVFSTALFILLYDSKTLLNKPLENNTLSKIGLLSYSLYLIHLPVGTMFNWLDVDLDLFYYLSAIFLISIFTYRYIEVPNRKVLKINIKTISYILLSIVIIILLNPLEDDRFESSSLKNNSFIATFREVPCHAPKYINNLSECFSQDKKQEDINIYLIGDSHITNHYQPLTNILKTENYKVEIYVDFGYINYLTNGETTCENLSCLKNGTRKINTFLKNNLDENDILIFSVARDRYVSGQSLPRSEIKEKTNILKSSLINIIENIVIPNGSNLYLVDDVPKPCINSEINWDREIIQFGNSKICFTDSSLSKQDRIPVTNVFLYLEQQYPNFVEYLDPHDYLCVDKICNIIENNLLIYADLSPHLTNDANFYLEAFWKDKFFNK